MGVISTQRGSRPAATHEGGLPVSLGVGSAAAPKRKWSNLMPFFVALVVIAEIAFLGKLDIGNNAGLVDSWADLFARTPLTHEVAVPAAESGDLGLLSCEEWLEREDAIEYSRDFDKEPVLEWKSCSVGCQFGFNPAKKPDAAFGLAHQSGTASVLRSMESAQYYAENNLAHARRRGYDIVMTTSLSSDVPVGYFSWAEYDIMAPVQPKTETALAAAFISNCGARNFRLQALEALESANLKIDSYGGCHRNRDGKGSIPVVVGAPNIEEYAPAPGSILHIKELTDVESVAKRMKYLADNPEAYNQSLRWKYEGPSDSFKALVDMAAVHSSCRLCIHLATMIREKEEMNQGVKKRPCKCTRGEGVVYHLYVRERGRFNMESIFVR
ncbi:hypothetical protein C1H46_044743 [Malus baccata]|uniref:Fucosyltransferase n=1 Tax=Malus baccata TaxID=106549 RepID=A0A540K681_MALBA|nr:hypothetical protein C1H46_044743 [Malus baccata]